VVALGAVLLAGCSSGARQEIGEAASEVADDVGTAAEEAGDVAEDAASGAEDLAQEAASDAEDAIDDATDDDTAEPEPADPASVDDEQADEPTAAGGAAGYRRPVPDQDGDFGEFTFGTTEYLAVARSCLDTVGDAQVRTFEVVDGETNNVLHVVVSGASGTDWFVDVYDATAGDDEPPMASGSGTGEQGDAERLNVDGTFDDGTPFSFSLVEIGPPDC
jgi:hypothetical protein